MKTYIPSLDGIRAVAILLVLGSHYGAAREIIPGAFGVTLFFFLSGFLITRLLIVEHEATGRIAIGDFYIRRFLRLAPALVFFLAVVAVTFWTATGRTYWPETAAAVFYFINYYVIFIDLPLSPIFALWSLAVEEHYYVFFPALFALGWRNKFGFLYALALACAVILAWRFALVIGMQASESRIIYATDTRIDSILFGAILAVLVAMPKFEQALQRIDGRALFVSGLSLLLFTFAYRSPEFRTTWRYTVQGLALIPIFYTIVYSPHVTLIRSTLETGLLVWIGRISYSLYLWHVAVFDLTKYLLPAVSPVMQYGLGTLLAIGAATFSYYIIERPFLSLRSRFRSPQTKTGAAPYAIS